MMKVFGDEFSKILCKNESVSTLGGISLKRNYFVFGTFILIVFILSSGCTDANDKNATISVSSDSKYVKTFEDLSLGILFDFDFKLPNADESWVTLWVEQYKDGKKESEPLTELSYGESPNEDEEGHLGFGILHPNTDDASAFLYGPGVNIHPSHVEAESKTGMSSTWHYAIDDAKEELELGEEQILAVYRETESSVISTVDLQDEEAINGMIEGDAMVLLLKIKIEKDPGNEK